MSVCTRVCKMNKPIFQKATMLDNVTLCTFSYQRKVKKSKLLAPIIAKA